MKEEVVIEIDEQGNLHVEGFGFVGPTCDKFVRLFDDLGSVVKTEKKPEWHQVARPATQARKVTR